MFDNICSQQMISNLLCVWGAIVSTLLLLKVVFA